MTRASRRRWQWVMNRLVMTDRHTNMISYESVASYLDSLSSTHFVLNFDVALAPSPYNCPLNLHYRRGGGVQDVKGIELESSQYPISPTMECMDNKISI